PQSHRDHRDCTERTTESRRGIVRPARLCSSLWSVLCAISVISVTLWFGSLGEEADCGAPGGTQRDHPPRRASGSVRPPPPGRAGLDARPAAHVAGIVAARPPLF